MHEKIVSRTSPYSLMAAVPFPNPIIGCILFPARTGSIDYEDTQARRCEESHNSGIVRKHRSKELYARLVTREMWDSAR